LLLIDSHDPTPLHAQLERSIRVAIATGRLRPGDRLPTVRQLAKDLGINPNTVAKVYSALERNNVLTTQRRTGTFVRQALDGTLAEVGLQERERVLHNLADRILGEAHAAGLTIEDVITHLESRRPHTR